MLLFCRGQFSMSSTALYTLWVITPALQGAIVLRMWSRRLHTEYPLFFAFNIEQILRFIILFYCYRSGNRDTYRHAYAFLQSIEAILQLGIICELFSYIFRSYEGIRELGSALLRWASVIFLLIAVIVAIFSSGSDSDRFLAGFFAMQRSLEIVQGGLLFLLFVLSSSLGLQWKKHTWGIALGLAIFTSVNLATFTLRAQLGMVSQDTLSVISSAGFDCAVLTWLVAVYAHKSEHHFEHRVHSWDVDSWNRALLDLLRH
jgi:hypothetical protein